MRCGESICCTAIGPAVVALATTPALVLLVACANPPAVRPMPTALATRDFRFTKRIAQEVLTPETGPPLAEWLEPGVMHGSVRGGDVRLDFRTSGEYLLVLDAGRVLYRVDPEHRAYTGVRLDSIARLLATLADSRARIDSSQLKVRAETLGVGETIVGYHTQRYRLTADVPLVVSNLVHEMRLQNHVEIDYWVATDASVAWPQSLSVQREVGASVGYLRAVARLIADAKRSLFSGLEVKAVMTTTTLETVDRVTRKRAGRVVEEMLSFETTSLPDSIFRLPAEFKAVTLPALIPEQLPGDTVPLAEGIAHVRNNELMDAIVSFAHANLLDPTDADVLAWSGEAGLRLGTRESAVEMARDALRLAPCHAFAHEVLAESFNPLHSSWSGADADSSWHHLRMGVGCDSTDGNLWMRIWLEAMRRGNDSLEKLSLRRLADARFLSSPAMAYNRLVLQSLPPRAILLTAGDLDTYPIHVLQETEQLRTDVAVVNIALLELPWYAERAARQVAGTSSRERAKILSDWRQRAAAGRLGRPLTMSAHIVADSLPGASGLRHDGLYWSLVAPESSGIDTAAVREALARVHGADLAGPVVTARDRSPSRRSWPSFGDIIVYIAVEYGDVFVDESRARDAERVLGWSKSFVRDAGLDSEYSRKALASFREAIDRIGRRD